jgi:O-antigen/teichoic acid export membrane protein
MNLRAKVLHGGAYLSLRQGLGMLISFGGVLLLTRAIGPEAYGLYVASIGVYSYLSTLSQLGIEEYLIRCEEDPLPEDYDQAFSLLLILGVGGGGLSLLGLPLLANWMHLEGFMPVAATVFVGLPFTLLALPPLARLERALDFRRIALVELAGQIVYYALALPLATSGVGVWSAIFGWWGQLILVFGLYYRLSGYRPSWHWEPARLRAMTSYGLGYSASMWVWQLRSLVNPLIVGRYAGAEAVAFIALAVRFADNLSFIRVASWRLFFAALAKLQNDKPRLTRALTEGVRLQVLVTGPLLLIFALIGPWLVPALFGVKWTPVMEIFPFIGVSYLAIALFSLNSSSLYVIRNNWSVTLFHLVHVSLFVGSGWLLVPRLGMVGYGWAEIAALMSYGVIYLKTIEYIGKPEYRLAGAWALAFGVALFWQKVGLLSIIPVLLILIWPESRLVVVTYWAQLLDSVREGGTNHG